MWIWFASDILNPEWVNSAVEPFVREVPDWQNETVLFKKGAKGAIYRPNLTLFTYLKLRRGSEVDLEDVRKAVASCPERFEEAKLRGWANAAVLERFRSSRARLGL